MGPPEFIQGLYRLLSCQPSYQPSILDVSDRQSAYIKHVAGRMACFFVGWSAWWDPPLSLLGCIEFRFIFNLTSLICCYDPTVTQS
ncbi:hypothetical protein Nepgr_019841 [Nepenthes gracilis]|uniref:Uncharacterized protein n=1 Tax=Nepenthes gracilis TaxID=150966 RepID=A0AAD3XVL2_NEPGR|nr:hypothetical protein Nepgr_019841 [Nepenthes gracilis]